MFSRKKRKQKCSKSYRNCNWKSQTKEHKFDVAYFDIPELNKEMLEKIEEAKQELGYFKNPTVCHSKDMRR